MVIDLRKPQIFERKMPHTLQRGFYIGCPRLDIF